MIAERDAVLAEVGARVVAEAQLQKRPVLVTVDGVDGAGKTTFADELAVVLRRCCQTVERASVDDFHHPRAHRHALGRDGETFWNRSFDYTLLVEQLLEPWRAGPGSPYRLAAHDVVTDQPVDAPVLLVPDRGVLVVDGIFTQRAELGDFWDLAVFLDVPFPVSVARMALRDGTVADPEHFEQRRYVEGQRIYLATCNPRARADVVVDNLNLARPRLVR